MMCPYDQHGICQMATRLANCIAKPSPQACAACKAEVVPMAINKVTASLAASARLRAGLPNDYDLLRLATGRYDLAGYKLERYIHKWLKRFMITPPVNCGCEDWVSKMNQWGIQGSLERLDEIAEQLYANLQTTYLAGISIAFLTKPLIKRGVRRCLLNERS